MKCIPKGRGLLKILDKKLEGILLLTQATKFTICWARPDGASGSTLKISTNICSWSSSTNKS